MPIMHVHHPAGSLTPEQKADLARRLTDVLLLMEGSADTPGGRAFATVLFTEVAAGDWWVGGRTDDLFVTPPGRFLVHVSIPEGYMNGAHKSEVHAWVTEAILDVVPIAGPADDRRPGGSVQVILDEVTEGNWGAGGTTISLDHIAEVVGLPKDGERFAWVRDYFAAKARQYEAAGYPTDTGALLTDQPAS